MPSAPMWQKIREYANLSEYEARVYASLIEEGPSTARRLSMLCGVPRTKIYVVLKKLVERKIVTEVPSSPKRFASLPPKDVFEPFLRLYEEITWDFYALISMLEENYTRIADSARMKRVETWVLLGRPQMLRKISEVLSSAQKSVDIVTTENGLILFYRVYDELLDELSKGGVEIRITAPINSKSCNIAKELRYICEVKHFDVSSSVFFLNADNDQFILACLIPDDYETSSDKDVGMYCRDPILGGLVTDFFFNSRNLQPLADSID